MGKRSQEKRRAAGDGPEMLTPSHPAWQEAPRNRRALAWLGAFASIGCTPREPLGTPDTLGQSRALGLHAREKGLAFDPDRPYTSEPYSDMPNFTLVTQTYRGYTKQWLQHGDDGPKIPWRGDVPDDPTPERLGSLAQFAEQWSPLPDMPVPEDTRGRDVFPWIVKLGQEERPQYCPTEAHTDRQSCPTCRYFGLMDVRNLVRDALASLGACRRKNLLREQIPSPGLSRYSV